jgi:hypothetical protein
VRHSLQGDAESRRSGPEPPAKSARRPSFGRGGAFACPRVSRSQPSSPRPPSSRSDGRAAPARPTLCIYGRAATPGPMVSACDPNPGTAGSSRTGNARTRSRSRTRLPARRRSPRRPPTLDPLHLFSHVAAPSRVATSRHRPRQALTCTNSPDVACRGLVAEGRKRASMAEFQGPSAATCSVVQGPLGLGCLERGAAHPLDVLPFAVAVGPDLHVLARHVVALQRLSDHLAGDALVHLRR